MESEALDLAAGLCLRFEGLYLKPYLCPAGIPTIGVGSTRYEDGVAVSMFDAPITKDRAIELLMLTLKRDYLPAVRTLCKVENAKQLAALTDFAYNLGVGALRSSNLRKRVNAGDYEAVPAEFSKWVKGGGKVLRGLVIRRQAEADLFQG